MDTGHIAPSPYEAPPPSCFRQQRIWVPSLTDPTVRIPISLVYKQQHNSLMLFPPVEPRKLILDAYGAYGGFFAPSFSPSIFPLLRRGLVYAICHARGDADLGTKWYTSAKYENKGVTLLDVGACLKGLVSGKRLC